MIIFVTTYAAQNYNQLILQDDVPRVLYPISDA